VTFQKTPRNSGRRRTLEQIRKDAEAARLFREGLTYQQAGDRLGVTRMTAYRMIKRAVLDAQVDALQGTDAFALIMERIHDHRRKLQEVIDHPCYLAGKDGKVVTMRDPATGKDEPVVDKGPVVRAITELRHHIELEAKLLDLFPAARSRVEVVTEDVVDREIEKLAKEIAEAGKAASAAVPSEETR
jgi:predicted DNA-binding protein (UPF0251 family)